MAKRSLDFSPKMIIINCEGWKIAASRFSFFEKL